MTVILKRFTLAEYDRLSQLGFFDGERVELIRGKIYQMASKGTAHSVCSTRLNRELSRLIGEQATLRSQEPIRLLTDSEPEPDFAIVQNRDDDYLSAHPGAEDILVVIEISDSSLKYDQEIKLSLYAEAGISTYWIFNLVDRCLEVYSDPYQTIQRQFGYRLKRIMLPNEAIALPNFADRLLNLTNLFPNLER